jgi:dTDP-4-dehydrorhamnose 3,5-epimerase
VYDLELVALRTHRDARGDLTELYRDDWVAERPVQWNLVNARPNTLRGVHVHVRHADYLVPVAGTFLVGLCDLRADSPTFMQTRMVELSSTAPALLKVPPGVAHGFYFARETVFTYGVTSYWDPVHDEMGCRWNDPALGMRWPADDPLLSERDATAPSCANLLERLDALRAHC